MPHRFTPRLHTVTLLLAAGAGYTGTADRLGLSINTVKSHTQRLRKLLGAHDSAHAVAIALRTGLITTAQIPDLAELPEDITEVPVAAAS